LCVSADAENGRFPFEADAGRTPDTRALKSVETDVAENASLAKSGNLRKSQEVCNVPRNNDIFLQLGGVMRYSEM
jgi:hypothetical protein